MVRKCVRPRFETVTMVIGWVSTAGSVISIIFLGFCLAYADTIKKVIDNLKPGDKDDEEVRIMLASTLMLYLSLNTMNLTTSFALIVGTLRYYASIFGWQFIPITKIFKARGTNKKHYYYSVKPALAPRKLNV